MPILIVLALFLTSLKPPTVQGHKPTADNRDHTNERHPPQVIESPFETQIREALRAIVRQQQTARVDDQANEKRWWPPSPSWAIVYVTVIYVVVAILQWRVIHRQANIANSTLNETKRSVDVQQRATAALLMLNRASVHFEKENDPGEIDYVRFEWGVKNYGRSPAIIEDRVAWICAITHLPPTPDYSRTLAHPLITEIAHEVFVGEQQESIIWYTIDLNVFAGEKGNDLYEAIYGGPSIIYVGKEIDPEAMHLIFYGRLRYTDVFGQEHITGFCYRWIPDTGMCQRFGGHGYNYTT